jgi:hypothetical protein
VFPLVVHRTILLTDWMDLALAEEQLPLLSACTEPPDA